MAKAADLWLGTDEVVERTDTSHPPTGHTTSTRVLRTIEVALEAVPEEEDLAAADPGASLETSTGGAYSLLSRQPSLRDTLLYIRCLFEVEGILATLDLGESHSITRKRETKNGGFIVETITINLNKIRQAIELVYTGEEFEMTTRTTGIIRRTTTELPHKTNSQTRELSLQRNTYEITTRRGPESRNYDDPNCSREIRPFLDRLTRWLEANSKKKEEAKALFERKKRTSGQNRTPLSKVPIQRQPAQTLKVSAFLTKIQETGVPNVHVFMMISSAEELLKRNGKLIATSNYIDLVIDKENQMRLTRYGNMIIILEGSSVEISSETLQDFLNRFEAILMNWS